MKKRTRLIMMRHNPNYFEIVLFKLLLLILLLFIMLMRVFFVVVHIGSVRSIKVSSGDALTTAAVRPFLYTNSLLGYQ